MLEREKCVVQESKRICELGKCSVSPGNRKGTSAL